MSRAPRAAVCAASHNGVTSFGPGRGRRPSGDPSPGLGPASNPWGPLPSPSVPWVPVRAGPRPAAVDWPCASGRRLRMLRLALLGRRACAAASAGFPVAAGTAPLPARRARRRRRTLDMLRLILLAHDRVLRLVAVVLAVQRLLLRRLRIPVAGILPLIGGQRRRRWRRAAVPLVPAAAALCPFVAPMLTPARRRIRLPPVKIRRRLAVIAHGNAQHVHRHDVARHQPPRPVVPGARVPVVALVDPVHAVVEEVVGTDLRRVVDRIPRHRDELRIHGQVDADAHVGKPDPDAHLGRGRRRRASQHPQHCKRFAHCLSSRSYTTAGARRSPRRRPGLQRMVTGGLADGAQRGLCAVAHCGGARPAGRALGRTPLRSRWR